MIVHDEETLEEALQMVGTEGSVRYSDQYAFVIVTAPETLEMLCRRAFDHNDIAIVVPRGQEHEMEVHSTELPKVRRWRAEEEKRKIKEWVREHPEQVEKFERRLQ